MLSHIRLDPESQKTVHQALPLTCRWPDENITLAIEPSTKVRDLPRKGSDGWTSRPDISKMDDSEDESPPEPSMRSSFAPTFCMASMMTFASPPKKFQRTSHVTIEELPDDSQAENMESEEEEEEEEGEEGEEYEQDESEDEKIEEKDKNVEEDTD